MKLALPGQVLQHIHSSEALAQVTTSLHTSFPFALTVVTNTEISRVTMRMLSSPMYNQKAILT